MSRDAHADRRFDDDEPAERSLTDEGGSIDEAAVKELALPVLERWERERSLDVVRARLKRVLWASLAVVAVGSFVDVGGLTGLLLQLWYFVSLPVAAVAGGMLATLKDPTAAREVWWESGLLVTLGLVALATLVRVGDRNPYGRAAWQLLTADESPDGGDYGFDDGIDHAAVAKIRAYVRYAVAGSLVVAGFEVITGLFFGSDLGHVVVAILTGASAGGGGGVDVPSIPTIPVTVPTDPLSVAVLLVVTVVVGVLLGFLVAVRREL